MQTIKINVENKVATAEGSPFIVCGNSDYTITFTFDKAWEGHETKTARFTYEQDGEEVFTEVAFTGNSCQVPEIYNTKKVNVGVYAGDILSTTRCGITCKPSILDGDGVERDDPSGDKYDQIIAICEDAVAAANEATAAAAEFEATTKETYANAIKGNLYGAVVRADDVSPVEHNIFCRLTSDTITDFSTVKVSRYGKNLIDFSKATFNGCVIKENGVQVNFADRYYAEVRLPYLKNFVQNNDGKTLTFSVGNTVPNFNIVIVIMYDDDTYLAKTGNTNAVSLKIDNLNRKVSNVFVRPLASPNLFTDTTTVINDLQLEISETATTFDGYKGVETYTPNADGTVEGITSLSPSMTLLTDTAGAVINCEYNRDTNKAITGNMVTAEGTVVSPNADFAEVAEWADGNPDNEDRTGYFVCANVPIDGIVMKKATSIDDVKGVSIQAPAFAGNYTKDKLDSNGRLLPKYSYVAIIGFVPVIDNGTCTVGGRCMPDDNGCAIPSSNSMGYQVVNRIDDNRVLIIIEPNGDMVQRIKTKINKLQEDIGDIETALDEIIVIQNLLIGGDK